MKRTYLTPVCRIVQFERNLMDDIVTSPNTQIDDPSKVDSRRYGNFSNSEGDIWPADKGKNLW